MPRTCRTAVRRTALALLALAGGASIVAIAGPLDPPAGPVSGTYKTLQEVEPRIPISAANTPGDANSLFKITQPGSYYLTGNVAGVSGEIGIEVVASNVTIDLSGFELAGVAGSLAGIDLNNGGAGDIYAVVVRNGSIRGWGNSGIMGNNSARDRFEDLDITANTGYGIFVNSGTIIHNCRLAGNTLDGIVSSNNVDVIDCVSGLNGRSGFTLGTSSHIQNCEAGTNQEAGIYMVSGGTVENCVTTGNGVVGIQGGEATVIANCRADRNFGKGIAVGVSSIIRGTTALLNGDNGIEAGAASAVEGCSAHQNTGSGFYLTSSAVTGCSARENAVDGFYVGSGSTIAMCTAASNVDDGIAASSGCTITQNSCSTNGNDGIVTGADNRIVENSCDNNGATVAGGGVHIVDGSFFVNSDNRIEGNNCTDNDYGIWVEDTGNLIVRNSASTNANANYAIVGSNSVAAIVNVAGNGSFSSSNAWGNLEF